MTNNNNINYNLNNTKKELLDIISKLKKTEIISMINQYNDVNNINNDINKNENMNEKINVKKEKIKIPSNLNKIKFNSRKSNNVYYKNY